MSIRGKVVLPFLLLLLPAFAAQAANKPAPTRFQVEVFTIKPGTAPVFEKIAMRYKAAAEKLGNRPDWYAYSPGVSDDLTYQVAIPISSFSQLADTSNDIETAFGADEAQKADAMVQASIANVHSYILRLRPDLSIAPPKMKTIPQMAINLTIAVKNGAAPEWEALMKKVIEATKKTEPRAYWQTYQFTIGVPNVYAIRVPMNWASMDKSLKPWRERLLESFGHKEGARLWNKASSLEVSE